MDNTQGQNPAKSQEQRIQTLESQVQHLMKYVEQLSANQIAQYNRSVDPNAFQVRIERS